MSRLESFLTRATSWLLRNEQAEWARAMRTELHHVDASERTSWAFGCLLAALKLRIAGMENGTLRVSPWVLLLELGLCFLPLTLGWFDTVFGGSGVWRLNATIVDRYFLDTPANTSIFGMMIGGAIVGLIGPIGVVLGLRAAIKGVGLRHRALGYGMIGALAAYIAASVSLRLVAGPGAYAASVEFIVLMFLLPATGLLHLLHLGGQAPGLQTACR